MTSFVGQIVQTGKTIEEQGGPRFRVRRPTVATPPLGAERGYARAILDIVEGTKKAIDEVLVPEIPRLIRQAGIRPDAARVDVLDIAAEVRRLEGIIRLRLDNQYLRDLDSTIRRYFNETNLHNRQELIKQIRRMFQIDAFPPDVDLAPFLSTFTDENRKLIKSIPNQYVDDVTNIVSREVRAGGRVAKVQELIEKRFDVYGYTARRLARDQVNKLNGALAQKRQTKLGLDKYIWRTSRDERVRNSHLDKEGKIFSWDDPPFDTGHPGQDIQCRCTAEPYITEEPPPKENRQKIIAQVKLKRKRLRERLKGKPSARLIARD